MEPCQKGTCRKGLSYLKNRCMAKLIKINEMNEKLKVELENSKETFSSAIANLEILSNYVDQSIL